VFVRLSGFLCLTQYRCYNNINTNVLGSACFHVVRRVMCFLNYKYEYGFHPVHSSTCTLSLSFFCIYSSNHFCTEKRKVVMLKSGTQAKKEKSTRVLFYPSHSRFFFSLFFFRPHNLFIIRESLVDYDDFYIFKKFHIIEALFIGEFWILLNIF
jgi:hypothetical protein